MKKIGIMVLIVFMLSCTTVYALDNVFKDIRGRAFNESIEMKKFMSKTLDPVLLSSMYDSCLLTIMQLDAYFHMLTIFNTLEHADISNEAVDSLTAWLNTIKSMNIVTMKSLGNTEQARDEETRSSMGSLGDFYKDLNDRLDVEIKKLLIVRKSLGVR